MSLQIRFYANISTALQKKEKRKKIVLRKEIMTYKPTNQPTDEHEGS